MYFFYSSVANKDDSIFVGYCKGEKTKGGIYEYPLNSERTDFQIPTSQNNFREIDHEEYLIAENFYCVSDIEPGPDGSLYATDYTKTGAIYKIVPTIVISSSRQTISPFSIIFLHTGKCR